MGWGPKQVGAGVLGQFNGDYGSAYYPLATKFVGSGLTTALEILIITSSFACAMAFYNTSARYLFSLSREGVLPAALKKTHPSRQSPHIASLVVTGLVFLYLLGFTIYDPSTEAFFLKLGTWTPLLGVLGILAVQALVSVAIIKYFMTEAKDGFHWWKTLVAPIIGGLAQAGACYLLIANRGALAGAGNVFFVKAIPWVVAIVFLAGVGYALWLKSAAPETFAQIGTIGADPAPVAVKAPAATGSMVAA